MTKQIHLKGSFIIRLKENLIVLHQSLAGVDFNLSTSYNLKKCKSPYKLTEVFNYVQVT